MCYSTKRRESMPNADVDDAATGVAATLIRLGSGDLAELRRMAPGNLAPWFWRLAARFAAIGRREEDWTHIVRILAILTPRGDPEKRPRLHQPNRRLGSALCDGGDTSWPGTDQGDPRPVYSELRLAKLLTSRGAQRPLLLTRAARSLVRSMPAGSGIDVRSVAYAVLYPDSARINNGLARSYYARLDAASRRARNQEEVT